MLSEKDKKQIETAITNLEAKKEEKSEKLSRERAFNAAAWAQYGSELCAAEMERNESNMSTEIIEITIQVSTLKKVLSGEIDISPGQVEKLQGKISVIENSIEHLKKQKEPFQKALKIIYEARGCIAQNS